ncbi:hypothetical protein PUNSTDRAFT_68460, partial [Punctularia strigosozonata HHB-11173 SS5]|uniref:uncharacterized protein n=1 Tax=Punctularia strigosozonata (strain HHB-11173) TaxID=741275 RepID=UPI0004418599
GTWANAMLYMLEILQIYSCFRTYPSDPLLLKLSICFLLLVDTVCSVAGCATAYLYSVTFWGDCNQAGIEKQYWSFPTYCSATALAAVIVQSFLIYKFWNL